MVDKEKNRGLNIETEKCSPLMIHIKFSYSRKNMFKISLEYKIIFILKLFLVLINCFTFKKLLNLL